MKVQNSCILCKSNVEKSPAVLMPFIAKRIFDWSTIQIDKSWGLRDIKEGYSYTTVNSCYCQACDFLFLDMRFDDEEMSLLYKDYRGSEYVEIRNKYEPGYEAINALQLLPDKNLLNLENYLSPFIPNAPRLLDWGGIQV